MQCNFDKEEQSLKVSFSCMSLYMRWQLRNFYTLHHLDDSYRNTISGWAVGFTYGNFTLKLGRGLIFGGEEISIPEILCFQMC